LKIDPTSDAALELTGGVAKAIADAERAASAAELDLLAEVETKQLPSRSGGTSKKKSSKKSKKTNALAALSASSSTNEAPTKKEIAIAAATASTIEEVREESTLRTSAAALDCAVARHETFIAEDDNFARSAPPIDVEVSYTQCLPRRMSSATFEKLA
jgi:hypothetical protein